MRRGTPLFLLLLLCSVPAWTQGRIDCDALKSHILAQPVHYCVMLPASYDASGSRQYPILYFLHGLNSNEQMLFKMGGWDTVQDMEQKHEIGDFLIVTPEARASFYVNSFDGKVRYTDFFLQEFVPYIEGRYRVRREREARAISGISMGGYGAFHLAFGHPELFGAVSAESAALMTESIEDLNTAIRAGTPLGKLFGPLFGNPIHEDLWKQSDPFVLAKKNKNEIRNLAIYFNCGKRDDFQFEVGAEVLHKQLDHDGIKNDFHLYPGDHSAGYFLAHLPEVMEFHWREFKNK